MYCRGVIQLRANQWYDLSIEFNTTTHEYTAWVGTKPVSVSYYPMLSNGNTIETISFIEPGTDVGLYLDDVMATIMPVATPTPAPTATSTPAPTTIPSPYVFNDTFEDAAGNNGMGFWDPVGSPSTVVADPADANGHAIQMNINAGTAWNELKRYMPTPLSGDVLLQYRLRLKDLTQDNKPIPRIYGDTGVIGEIVYNSGGGFLIQSPGANHVLPGGDTVASNQWYDLSIEFNISTHEYTAWVGTKPVSVSYYPMLSNGNTVETISFIEPGTDAGLFLDDVTATLMPTATPTPTPSSTPSPYVFNDTFEDAAGNNAMGNWDAVGSPPTVVADPQDSNGHVMKMNINTGTAWNELKRYMPTAALSGDVLLQYRLRLNGLTDGPIPRIYDATTPIGQILFNSGNLVLQTDGALPILPNGAGVQLNQWYDLSIEFNTMTHQYTAWVGAKPVNVTYYPMLSNGNTVETISFIEQETDSGLYLDDVKATATPITINTPQAFNLSAPADSSTNVSLTPTLSWEASIGADSYSVIVSADNSYTNPIVDVTDLSDNHYLINSDLDYNTTYYWKVTATNDSGSTVAAKCRSHF